MGADIVSPDDIFDTVIIGGGPAGLTAGLYAARARMKTILIESMSVMSQVTMTDIVENYPGVKRAGGFDFLTAMKDQAEAFGLSCRYGTVRRITAPEAKSGTLWEVEYENGVYRTFSVIIASGARPKKLDIPGEAEFTGRGVSYCATCDGAFFRSKTVVVAGGGDTAVEEALFLTRFADKVIIVHRRDRLRAAKILQERAVENPKISFVWDSAIESVGGDQKVEKITVRNIKTAETSDIACDGVFVFVGWEPNTDFADDLEILNEQGSISVDSAMRTSRKGIFAAGDCTAKILHQIITACSDGATAAYSAQRYADEIKGQAYPGLAKN